ncbi:MAG: hypothetical protein HY674_14985 [Chloroflexi bacterium]|nr:hypothetical protein [Chloroflexota bacterium]
MKKQPEFKARGRRGEKDATLPGQFLSGLQIAVGLSLVRIKDSSTMVKLLDLSVAEPFELSSERLVLTSINYLLHHIHSTATPRRHDDQPKNARRKRYAKLREINRFCHLAFDSHQERVTGLNGSGRHFAGIGPKCLLFL